MTSIKLFIFCDLVANRAEIGHWLLAILRWRFAAGTPRIVLLANMKILDTHLFDRGVVLFLT